ncbi:acyl-CoA desaturase [Paraconexibacter antarcticus]|uniref:Acyl-CoA desaturase n=1 Tax=Paraconexibacter antarcticus TaxID=2949664 RepID=A0ABY5DTR5_9ACTN|nr:acyl-CoA desaturase [Paraconexibacter antarcticus]UTI64065.1 acyl-CoA desaturase [Paraconexibacter antarcticus]
MYTDSVTTPKPTPFAHLTPEDVAQIGRELDAIRDEVVSDLGEQDARYIRKVIATQRALEVAGRGALQFGLFPPAWVAGTTALTVAKILENMEIGHNVMHGQWDWMRDPEIHSSTWEWDNVSSAEGWKHSHNFEHHTFTNVVGKDRDLGYEIMRIDPAQPWKPVYLAQPVYNVALALLFQWGVALHDVGVHDVKRGNKDPEVAKVDLKRFLKKARKQLFKDYLLFPALSGPSFVPNALGNLTANLGRNLWSYAIIFCGHFPDGVETFEYSEQDLEDETRGGWYLRQLAGSANLDGGRLFHIMAGNLSHQIEHHLFPDVPSNRYQEMSPRVREICARYDLPYTSGPLPRQYFQVLSKITRLAFPGGGKQNGSPVPATTAATRPAAPQPVTA